MAGCYCALSSCYWPVYSPQTCHEAEEAVVKVCPVLSGLQLVEVVCHGLLVNHSGCVDLMVVAAF